MFSNNNSTFPLFINKVRAKKKKERDRYKIEKNGGYDNKPYENVYSSI